MNAPIRTFRYVPLPPPSAGDTLEALTEAIEEEFSDRERQEFAKGPIAGDVVYQLIRRNVRGGIELVDIARLYGLTRERVRQIERDALMRVRDGMKQWRPE